MLSEAILDEVEKISRRLEDISNSIERANRECLRKMEKIDKPNPWGRDDLVVLAAFRYCVGRRTHIVQECVDCLVDNWSEFDYAVRGLIKKELEELFYQDDLYRAGGGVDHRPLGNNCDRLEWERVRALWAE